MALFLRGLLDGLRRNSPDLSNPYRVVEVKPEDHVHCSILSREDCLVLYLNKENSSYETVLHQGLTCSNPNVAYSLHRTTDQSEAEIIYLQLRDKIPLIVTLFPEMLTKDTIQELCDIIRKNPGWTLAHIVAHFGQVDSFKNEIISGSINETCKETLVTPLHIAIKRQHFLLVQTLIAMDARLDILDVDGNSIYHYAAITNKDIIQVLASKPNIGIINLRNNKGHTPLHLACLNDKPECVKELLRSGADVNIAGTDDGVPLQCAVETSSASCAKEIIDMYPNQLHAKDMKNGGTPLHWAKTAQCLQALIELGCKLDSKNFQGDTALHVMIQHNRFACVMALLSNGANPNLVGSDGNTPLHLAVKSGDITLVQALIVFGADINSVNGNGETPRHIISKIKTSQKELLYVLHAVGAKRCPVQQEECFDGCSNAGTFDGRNIIYNFSSVPKLYDELIGAAAVVAALQKHKNQSSSKNTDETDASKMTKRCRLLCLDGGGIRGLVLIQMLSFIENIVNIPIIHCFDWLAGTSTGGILALALAIGKSISECRCLYFRLKDKVFVGARPYVSENLEKFLQSELGENTRMSEIKYPRVMVTGVLADRHPADLHIFRNYDPPFATCEQSSQFKPPPTPDEQLVWRAARSTGAAPTYFRSSGRFIDGGLIANNPTLDALTEIHQCNEFAGDKYRIEVVVSLGTGKLPVVPVNTIDVFRPDTFWGVARMAMGASALGQLLVDQATQSDGRVVDRAQAWCSMIRVPYFRLNPPLSENISLDETDTKILVRMLWEVTAFMHSKREELEDLATLIMPL
ncbi:85/88 kDa calcium-independent phospholipase A2 [Centruroides vittatus]|uniref:85/88 kDa calcium-independent phospholipase A2 n=1 Tax=Centruroides vittatus TaxID=120091 RepID=UPI00350F4893